MRLRSDFWIAALRRRAEAAGAFVSVARHGADEAGAIFVLVDHCDGRFDLYGPAPQSAFADEPRMDRLFLAVLVGVPEAEARHRMDAELRFDPDLWRVDIEDRAGRCFIEVMGNAS